MRCPIGEAMTRGTALRWANPSQLYSETLVQDKPIARTETAILHATPGLDSGLPAVVARPEQCEDGGAVRQEDYS